MYTVDKVSEIGKGLMINPQAMLSKLAQYKSSIQIELTNQLTQQEAYQVAMTDKPSQPVFEKLINICQNKYQTDKTDQDLYLISFATAAIVKDYQWGNESVFLPESLTNIANMIAKEKTCSIFHI